jgi:hypothetical protein
MPNLWCKSGGAWGARKLAGSGLEIPADKQGLSPAARLIQSGAEGAALWALISPARPSVRVNGRAVAAGLRVMEDRDEIRIGDSRFFFSAESIAEVVEFPGAVRPVFCGRCRLPIATGSPAVCCPDCGIWHHQGGPENRLCWTYAPTCSYCQTQTELGSELKWAPEE